MVARHLGELGLQVREGLAVSPALPVQPGWEETSGGIGQLRLQQSRGPRADVLQILRMEIFRNFSLDYLTITNLGDQK